MQDRAYFIVSPSKDSFRGLGACDVRATSPNDCVFSLAIGAVLLPGLVLLSTALRLFQIRLTQLDTRGDDAHNDCQAVQMPLHFVKRSISSRAYA